MTSKINLRIFLPPATKLGQGYVFTRVCDSVHRGDVPACIAGGIPACLAGLQATPRGEVEGSGLGGSPDPHLGGFQAHTQGVSRPTPRGNLQAHTWGGLQAHTQGEGFQTQTWGGGLSRPTPGGISQHALRQTMPPRRLLLRAVRILLECILVERVNELSFN